MSQIAVIARERFEAVPLDIYGNGLNEFYMTRQQIGQALGYSDPLRAISKIHARKRARLDPLSGVVNLTTPGGVQEVTIYSFRGVCEICRWSNQPKADAFMDFVWDILERLQRGEIGPQSSHERRIQRLEELARVYPLPVCADRTTAFLEAMERAIADGWELLPSSTTTTEGRRVLGFYDDVAIYLLSKTAYTLYQQYDDAPTTKTALFRELRVAGIVSPSPQRSGKSVTSFVKQVAGKGYFVMSIYRSRFDPVQ